MHKISQVLKFLLYLSAAVFLSLTAQVYYAPSVWDQDAARVKCLREITPEQRGRYTNTFMKKDGAGLTVLLTSDDMAKSIVCTVRDGKISMIVK